MVAHWNVVVGAEGMVGVGMFGCWPRWTEAMAKRDKVRVETR